MTDKVELDAYEQRGKAEIEASAPVGDETRKQVAAISELAKKRKNVNINGGDSVSDAHLEHSAQVRH